MENPFFTAIEGNGFDASTLAQQSNDVLMPFMHYLNNSIQAMENKEVSCIWKPVANVCYHLKPNLRIWRLIPVSEIKIVNDQEGWFEILSEGDGTPLDEDFYPDLADPAIAGKGAARQRFTLNKDHYRQSNDQFEIYLPELGDQKLIQWSGYQLSVRPLTVCLDQLELVHVDGQECKVTQQMDSHLLIEGLVTANSVVTMNGQKFDFNVLSTINDALINKYPSKKEGNGWLLFSENKPNLTGHKIFDITHKILSEVSLGHFEYNGAVLNHDKWSLTADKDCFILEALGSDTLQKGSDFICLSLPEISFVVEPRKLEEKWIQLIEKDNAGDDSGQSELDYFFVDNQNIKILDSTQRKHDEGFRVLKVRPDERQILLAPNSRDKKKGRGSEYPSDQDKKCEIRVSVDTSQLKRQKEAINQLKSRPQAKHLPLIHLLQDRHKKRWQSIQPVLIAEKDWIVLSDPNFDGCDRQREFVSKALATEDFAILDGPPGTGKTTSILELIIQLVLKGKRVLLSASTHAAINNVLERIQESPTLAEQIFPLRIGYESNATGVEDYHFDNQFNQLKETVGCENLSKQLLVDASNLVCGTTLGILRLFNDKEISMGHGEPPFDVMIIDECSKTTFQEFLVPARFAKCWVLVGDVRQLSPFTDREQIVANLDNLMLVPPKGNASAQTLSPAVQQACYLLEELRGDNQRLYKQPMLLPVSKALLQALKEELIVRKGLVSINKGLENILLIQKIDRNQNTTDWIKNVNTILQEPWHLYGSNLCFIDENIINEIQQIIPDDMLVLHKYWHLTHQAMLHKNNGTSSKAFKIKTNEFTDTVEIQKELLDRINTAKWSEEVCWRLEREYWLRLSANYQKKTGYLTATLERLFPKSVNADGRIHVLKNIAFPSILEALSGDGLQRRRKDNPTTLNQGFRDKEKGQRHSTLTYQHRMHPDISTFPRNQFYPQGVLKDGSQTVSSRTWDYKQYKTRNVWRDVEGKAFKNANEKEVQKIINDLKVFCDWAQNKAKNKKGDPFDVAILTFYKGQEKALRNALQKLSGDNRSYARFTYEGIPIKLATVDYFQGQEADLVFLSMVNTQRDGFMDSPNRLNVAITRARFQLVIVGHKQYFSKRSRTEELRNLASPKGIK